MSDGRLTDAELEAIRERRKRVARSEYVGGSQMAADISALLAHADALAAGLAAAEGEREDLNHVVACMKNDRLAYQCGVEDERRRVLAVLREMEGKWRALAGNRILSDLRQKHHREIAAAIVDVARALESPPAPAAAQREE